MGGLPHAPRAWAARPYEARYFHPRVVATGWNDCFVTPLLAMKAAILIPS
jgi:hypothetical protein